MEDHGWGDDSAEKRPILEDVQPLRPKDAIGECVKNENNDGKDSHHEEHHYNSSLTTDGKREASNQASASVRCNEHGKSCDNGRDDDDVQFARQPIVSRRYDEEQGPRAYYGDLEVSDINATRASVRPMRQWGMASHQPPSSFVADRRIFEESLTKETLIQRQGGQSIQVKHVEMQSDDQPANISEHGAAGYAAQECLDNDSQCASYIPLREDMNDTPVAGDKGGDFTPKKGGKEIAGSIESDKEEVDGKGSNTILVQSDFQQPMVMLIFPPGYTIVQRPASHTDQGNSPQLHHGQENQSTSRISVSFGQSAVASNVTVHDLFKAYVEERR